MIESKDLEKHTHYCAQCNTYWQHNIKDSSCIGQGEVFGPWIKAKQCKQCVERLRKEAISIYYFELIARHTRESITGELWQ